jgi:type I restriction enzyme, S subunit
MSNWPFAPLSEVAEPVERCEVPVTGNSYRQVGVKLWGVGAYEREPIDGGGTQYKTLSRVEADDIIINKIWARNGSVAVVPTNLAGCYVSAEFPTFTPIPDKLEPRWFHWITKTRFFWDQCDVKSRGTSGKNRIRPDRFLEIQIPLPPPPEQRRIVARIEKLAAKINEACGLRQNAVAEVNALLASSISRLLQSLTCKTMAISQLVGDESLQNGRSVKSTGDIGEVRCVTLSAMRNGRIDIHDNKVVPLTPDEAEPYLIRKGDVFIVRGNGSKNLCGMAGLVSEESDSVIFPDLFIHVPLPEQYIAPEFFVAVWNSPATREVIEEKAKTTSGIWKINQGHISSTEIPVPSLPEQRRILAELNVLHAQVAALKGIQAETAAELETLLPSILDKAFKGEL